MKPETEAILGILVNKLPEKYGQVLLLTEFQGLTQKELAQKLGISFIDSHPITCCCCADNCQENHS